MFDLNLNLNFIYKKHKRKNFLTFGYINMEYSIKEDKLNFNIYGEIINNGNRDMLIERITVHIGVKYIRHPDYHPTGIKEKLIYFKDYLLGNGGVEFPLKFIMSKNNKTNITELNVTSQGRQYDVKIPCGEKFLLTGSRQSISPYIIKRNPIKGQFVFRMPSTQRKKRYTKIKRNFTAYCQKNNREGIN